MSESTNIRTIEMPAEGPLVLDFTLYYKDGSYDHTRRGRQFREVRLSGGSRHSEYSLGDGDIPSVTYVSNSFRTSPKHQETRSVLTIEPNAPLPLTVLADELDEYHPDYYNEQGLSWEERHPTINNKELEFLVVARASGVGGASC